MESRHRELHGVDEYAQFDPRGTLVELGANPIIEIDQPDGVYRMEGGFWSAETQQVYFDATFGASLDSLDRASAEALAGTFPAFSTALSPSRPPLQGPQALS